MKKRLQLFIFLVLSVPISAIYSHSAEYEGFITKWQIRLTDNLFSFRPLEYSGCAVNPEFQRIFVTNRNGEIISINTINGDIEWRLFLKHPIHLKPIYREGILYIASTGGEIIALDTTKKRPSILWKKEVQGGIISDITIDNDILIFLTERNTLHLLSIKNGSTIQQINNDFIEGFTIYSNTPIIALKDKIIYVLSTGELYSIDKNDSKTIYKINIFNPDDKIDGFTGLISYKNNIILSTLSGLLYKIDSESGKIIWSRTLSQISTIKQNEESGDIFVFHSDGTIAVYDSDGKTVIKKTFLKKHIIGADVNDKRIIVRYTDGKMLLLSKNDLSFISLIRLDSPLIAPITYEKNYAYVFSSKGSLIKFLIQ